MQSRELERLKKETMYMKIELDVQKSHLQRLNDLAQVLNSSLNSSEISKLLLENIEQILNYDYGIILLKDVHKYVYNAEKYNIENFIESQKKEICENEEILNYLAEKRESVLLENKILKKITNQNSNIKSGIFVPIIFSDEIIGILFLFSTMQGVFTKQELEIADLLVSQAGIAYENAKLYTCLESRNKQLDKAIENLKSSHQRLVSNEKMAALGRIISGISHELNSPLGGMKTAVYLSKVAVNDVENIKIKEDLRENIEYIDIGIEKMINIISKLKELSKEKTDQNFRVLDLSRSLKEYIEKKQFVYKKQNIDIILTAHTKFAIKGDRSELINAIDNIFENAKDSILEKRIHGYILIGVYEEEENYCIEIKDNGTGMTPDTLKMCFEPFFTTKDISKGLGLGLSQTYETIKKHNAHIKIESQIDKGTKVSLLFQKRNYI